MTVSEFLGGMLVMSSSFETDPPAGPSPEQSPLPPASSDASSTAMTGLQSVLALLSIGAGVILADITLYRTQGWFGPAVFFPIAAVLLLMGSARRALTPAVLISGFLIVVFSARLSWSGSVAQCAYAFWLLNIFAMCLQRIPPWPDESMVFFAGIIPGGFRTVYRIQSVWRNLVLTPIDRGHGASVLSVLVPLTAVVLFSVLFIMANPDIASEVSTLLGNVSDYVNSWLRRFTFPEAVFWCGTAWIVSGLIATRAPSHSENSSHSPASTGGVDNPLYASFRNTLVSLTILFAAYLFFEFRTLWFRNFPPGFHYSGYAHQGAAWLTAALALATVTLSLIFRGTMMNHSRLEKLERWAWIWSSLNFLLAASVYNRLLIYVIYNGMTRMRVVGLLGITCVVAGFILVLWKIRKRRTFFWLVRRQICVPIIAAGFGTLMPVDLLVHRFNVHRILDGHPEPSVQISEHPIDRDAMPALIPLLNCPDKEIQEGVRASLARALKQLRGDFSDVSKQHWTTRQFGLEQSERELSNVEQQLGLTRSDEELTEALTRFHDYTIKWW
jgi:hypothetical protein